MNSHKNERLTAYSRALLVKRVLEEGLRPIEVARAQGVSVRTVYKWLRRFREEGRDGLVNRSSRPCSCPHEYSQAVQQEVIRLRQERRTYRQISMALKVGKSTVARILERVGLNRLANLEPPRPINRYEHELPGDMLHLDIKKLGKFERPGHRVTGDRTVNSHGAGWEYVHVAIDDHSRVAHATLQENETAMSACKALLQSLIHYTRLGVRIKTLLTDNGACYRSREFQRLCHKLGLKHRFTRPYTPRTNGKAERFIQTSLQEWAYARSYENSNERGKALQEWLHHYNYQRSHAGINYQPPVQRLGLIVNNVLGLHI